MTLQIELERRSHDPIFVLSREADRRRISADMRRFRRLVRESEPDVSDDAEYVSPDYAFDLEREAMSGGACRGNGARRRAGAEFAVEDAFDGDDIAPEIVAHASSRQVEQAVLLRAVAANFERAGDTKRAGSFRAKAARQAWCGIIGHAKDCTKSDCRQKRGKFFKRHDCRLRYCPRSGPKAFRELYVKHSGRLSLVAEGLIRSHEESCRPRVIAKIDITLRNTGKMPSREAVQTFNENIRRLFRRVERRLKVSRRDYGFAWMDEFGSGNENLHAHGVYVGPWLPQKLLSEWWYEITGDSFIISIKSAPSFERALSHALKYPSKFWDAAPSRLVELEVAFHKVRRFHALARFFNPPETRYEPGMNDGKDEAKRCPFCGSYLQTPIRNRSWRWISDLCRDGRIDLEEARIIAGREKVLSGAGPP